MEQGRRRLHLKTPVDWSRIGWRSITRVVSSNQKKSKSYVAARRVVPITNNYCSPTTNNPTVHPLPSKKIEVYQTTGGWDSGVSEMDRPRNAVLVKRSWQQICSVENKINDKTFLVHFHDNFYEKLSQQGSPEFTRFFGMNTRERSRSFISMLKMIISVLDDEKRQPSRSISSAAERGSRSISSPTLYLQSHVRMASTSSYMASTSSRSDKDPVIELGRKAHQMGLLADDIETLGEILKSQLSIMVMKLESSGQDRAAITQAWTDGVRIFIEKMLFGQGRTSRMLSMKHKGLASRRSTFGSRPNSKSTTYLVI